jgi:phosphonate transport system permease protein
MSEVGPIIRRTIFDAFVIAYLFAFAFVAITRPVGDDVIATMGQHVMWFGILAIAGGVASVVLSSLKVRTLGHMIYAPPHERKAIGRDQAGRTRPIYATFWGIQIILTLLVTIVLGVFLTDANFIRLLEAEPFQQAMRLFNELAHPDWAILPKAIMKIIESVYIAFMATALAVPLAFFLSFLTARNVMGRTRLGMLTYTLLRATFNISRSIEPVLWAIIFSVWVSFGPFAGMLALMVHSVASLTKQYSEYVESVDDGPIEGIESTGAGRMQTLWFAVVPQVILPYISYTIYRWDTNVRMATILGFVGGGGIGTMLMEYQGQARWHEVGTIIVVIAAVVWLMDAFSSHIREAIK